jgi:hypothetical protein
MLRVTTVQAAHSGEAVSPALDAFEVEYVTDEGAGHRVDFGRGGPVRIELAAPGAGVAVTPGQPHLPGR